MKNKIQLLVIAYVLILTTGCSPKMNSSEINGFVDKPFVQDYSVKYLVQDENVKLLKVESDRNGFVQILSSKGLLKPVNGQFLFPGKIVDDYHYKPTTDKKISDIGIYQNQLVYLDDKSVFSNAWAGKLFSQHPLTSAKIFNGGDDFTFLITDGKKLILLKNSKVLWDADFPGEVCDIKYDESNKQYWILGKETISVFSPEKEEIEQIINKENLTCIEIFSGKLIIGTTDGYLELDTRTRKQTGGILRRLPCTEITAINEIRGDLWFGSASGAFRLHKYSKIDYYASERWLPSDDVIDISPGPENSVLILTGKGLAKICFNEMTLYDKALFYEKQTRERHIRHGFNATVGGMENGDIATGSLEDSDNDGLWTSMYVAGQAFRYALTKEEEALYNVRESLDALERLFSINPIPGFPARSFERRGYKYGDKPWRRSDDPEWDWKSTTSSDEVIGHIFAYGVIAELIDVNDIREKSILLIDILMSHILKNKFYLVDWNGEPTLWGKWNPEYVNARPSMVGDRRLNSSNIIGMLQTAYHFTEKEKYREAAFNLMIEHGYLENLTRPISEIGPAPENSDSLSKMLSDGWNHSDDEMYFCGYWGLYRYAFNDTLKAKYTTAIIDHWKSERPEREGLWNIMTAVVKPEDSDLEEAIWYLQEYPLDLIDWSVKNSLRKDIEVIQPNFRGQTIREVLPPDELPVTRHNANRFKLDGNGAGKSEYSAGDIWLLPYWMGRYLKVISEPEKQTENKILSGLN